MKNKILEKSIVGEVILSYSRNKKVLSACETGLGDISSSQGVFGLQRAFKIAGAQKILMSLWNIPDEPTYEFMARFYTLIFETKNIDKAFRQTQIEFNKKYDPYYWASFVLLD